MNEEQKEAEEAIKALLNQPKRTDSDMMESARQRALLDVQNNPDLSEDEKQEKIKRITNAELEE